MTGRYDRAAFAKAEKRNFRLRYEMSNQPFVAEIEAAARRMGLLSRADASDSVRVYIWNKKRALAAHIVARQAGAYVTQNGREF